MNRQETTVTPLWKMRGPARSRLFDRVGDGFERRHALVALALYVAGSLVIQNHAVAHIGSVIVGNIFADPTQYMWAMWWWPHAIFHSLNPFVTREIFVPGVYNLASVASTPLLALVMTPVTLLCGPVQGPIVSYNICNLAAPVVNAWFAYRLCLYVVRRPAPAVLGGWLYGFSVYWLSQLQGHLNLVFTFLPALLALLFVQRLDRLISRRRFVVLVSLALIVQVLIGSEIVLTTTCLGVLSLLLALAMSPAPVRRRIVELVPEMLGAYAVAGIVCSPFLYYALNGPVVAFDDTVNKSVDLLSFVVPTPLIGIGGTTLESVTETFRSGFGSAYAETGTYIGIPIIAAALAAIASCWRWWSVRVLTVIVAVAVIWALGPVLAVGGDEVISLPWKLVSNVRLFNQVTPARIGMYVDLGCAILCAIWVSAPGRFRWWRWLVVLVGVVALFPNVDGRFPKLRASTDGQPIYAEHYHTPRFITAALYRRKLRPDEVILPIPPGAAGASMLWQAQARGYFRMAGGYLGYASPAYNRNTILLLLLQVFVKHPGKALVEDVRSFLIAHDVSAVVMQPPGLGSLPVVMAKLGLRRQEVGGVWLYSVPSRLHQGA